MCLWLVTWSTLFILYHIFAPSFLFMRMPGSFLCFLQSASSYSICLHEASSAYPAAEKPTFWVTREKISCNLYLLLFIFHLLLSDKTVSILSSSATSIHSNIYTESLLCVKHCRMPWEYRRMEENKKSLPSWSLYFNVTGRQWT